MFPISQTVDIVTSIDYSAQAVVSKTIVKKDTGTITLFAFDKEQELSEHTAPFDALVQIIEGRACLSIAGNKIIADAGQMVLMPANVPHSVYAVENFKMLLIMIRS